MNSSSPMPINHINLKPVDHGIYVVCDPTDPNATCYITLAEADRMVSHARRNATIRVDTFISALKDLLNND